MGMSMLDRKQAEKAVTLVKEHIKAGTRISHSFTELSISKGVLKKEMHAAASVPNYKRAQQCFDIMKANNAIIQLMEACLEVHTYLKEQEMHFCKLYQFDSAGEAEQLRKEIQKMFPHMSTLKGEMNDWNKRRIRVQKPVH